MKKNFAWNASLYERFLNERNLALKDLIFRIQCALREFNKDPSKLSRILDLGCGPANAVPFLRELFKEAKIIGIDSSADMIKKASSTAYKDCEFILHDVNEGLESLGSFDLIFANASIHWIRDQKRLFDDLFRVLNINKSSKNKQEANKFIAVQIPLDHKSIFHNELQALAKDPKWKDFFPSARAFSSLSMKEYYELLSSKAAKLWFWEVEYVHILDDTQTVIEWYRGSGLRPYLERLGEEKGKDFEKDLLARLDLKILKSQDKKVLMQMPRLFFVAAFN